MSEAGMQEDKYEQDESKIEQSKRLFENAPKIGNTKPSLFSYEDGERGPLWSESADTNIQVIEINAPP